MSVRQDNARRQRILRAISITVVTLILNVLSDELDTFENTQAFKDSKAPRLRDIVIQLDAYLAVLKAANATNAAN